jgi:quinoprotein dehydrogenase-associated probable ABC transporter substrate-binding protein
MARGSNCVRVVGLAGLLLALLAPAWTAAAEEAVGKESGEFRVCADPNNLPFSNDKGEGFENKLAELIAKELGKRVTYFWWAQRRGFVRNTLKAGRCDVIIGVPAQLEMVATTRPYYRSSYVFLSRDDRRIDLVSISDPRLRDLRIGVHLLGDDGFNTPPANALGEEGITRNVVGYSIYGDYRTPNPPARLVGAVADGEVDIAAVWGPLAGYFAQRSPVPLRLVPITGTEAFAPLLFQFDIAMGVRNQDKALKDRLDEILARDAGAIRALLVSYGVPLVTVGEGGSVTP